MSLRSEPARLATRGLNALHRWKARSSKPIRVLDLGSGAGFPALPIKIWAPHIHLTMIESNQKKATFLREAARALKLTDVNVIAERAESVAARLSSPSQVGKTARSRSSNQQT